MLWTFGKFKGMHISESPVPNWLRTESNICRRWPRRQLIEIVIDENRLDRFGPPRYDIAPEDALLRATLVRAGTWFLSHSNNSLRYIRRQIERRLRGTHRTRKSLSAFGWTFENRVSFHAIVLTVRKATSDCRFWVGLGLALLQILGGHYLHFV